MLQTPGSGEVKDAARQDCSAQSQVFTQFVTKYGQETSG